MISAPFRSLSDDGLLFLYFLCVVLVELISITLLFVLYRGEWRVVRLNSGCILVFTRYMYSEATNRGFVPVLKVRSKADH